MKLFIIKMKVVTCLGTAWFSHPVPYQHLIIYKACHAKINPVLVAAIIRTESDFNPKALGHDTGGNSRGLGQIKWTTAKWLGFNGTKKQLMNPYVNLNIMMKYLRFLVEKFPYGYDPVSAYNLGTPIWDGHYINQTYVNKVRKFYREYGGRDG